MTMLTFEPLTYNNLQEGLLLQKSIFPEECDYDTLEKSLSIKETFDDHITYSQFWLAKQDDVFIGFTGLYAYNEYPKDMWLNWFGVDPKYRRRGMGEKIFRWTAQKAKAKGAKYLRLYTESGINDDAVQFYRRLGLREESYTQENEIKNIFIFSLGLSWFRKEKWKNRPIFLFENLLFGSTHPLQIAFRYPASFFSLLRKRPHKCWHILKKTVQLKIKSYQRH